jgi:hypothetical protein
MRQSHGSAWPRLVTPSAPGGFSRPESPTILGSVRKALRRQRSILRDADRVGYCSRLRSAVLDELLGNLIDNASKWARQRVPVAADRVGTMVEMTIEDDGPGLSDQQTTDVMKSDHPYRRKCAWLRFRPANHPKSWLSSTGEASRLADRRLAV